MERPTYYARYARRRNAEEVVTDHLHKLQSGAVDEDIVRNYAEDAVVLNGSGVHRGHAGARRAARTLLKSLAGARLEVRHQVVYGEYAFIEWCGVAHERPPLEGADTFVIRNGQIAAHTSHYSAPGLLQH